MLLLAKLALIVFILSVLLGLFRATVAVYELIKLKRRALSNKGAEATLARIGYQLQLDAYSESMVNPFVWGTVSGIIALLAWAMS